MKETEQYNTIEEFHNAMHEQHHAMDSVVEGNEFLHLKEHLIRLRESVIARYPYDHLAVITGEQPYGALGTTKVLSKRLLARTLTEGFGDVTSIELFNNHDLVGSESRFYRLEVPTAGAQDGIFKLNFLTEKLRRNGLTAQGIVLPNESVTEQAKKAQSVLPIHYPSSKINGENIGLDETLIDELISSYVTSQQHSLSEFSYSDAHISWTTQFEKKIGLEMKHITKEGDFDLMLLRNGGIEVLEQIWEHGLHRLRDSHYESVALKLDDQSVSVTPFNIAENGIRLISRFTKNDKTMIEIIHPKTKESTVITVDEALSGEYGISLRAVPRVVLYSLAGMDGHITGGGSVYNSDAQSFMDTLSLPYFPIIHMNAQKDGGKVSNIQYSSIALVRKDHPLARKQVQHGQVSLLDLALSCHFEEVKKIIDETSKKGGALRMGEVITIPNKAGQLPE